MIHKLRNSPNNTGLRFACVAVLAVLFFAVRSHAQTSETSADTSGTSIEMLEEDGEVTREEPTVPDENPDESKAGYSATKDTQGGSKTVTAELIDGDRIFDTVFNVDWVNGLVPGYYEFKKSLNERRGLAYNVDYSVLASGASFSSNDDKNAASSVFRIYGAWRVFGESFNSGGSLISNMSIEAPSPEHRRRAILDSTRVLR